MDDRLPATRDHTMVTTGFELDNFRVVRNLGVVRGLSCDPFRFLDDRRGLQTLVGGNITAPDESYARALAPRPSSLCCSHAF